MSEGLRRRAVLVSASVMGFIVLASASIGASARAVPRQATATNGRIVFQAGVGSKAAQVFTILPDGTDMNQVTHIPRVTRAEDPARRTRRGHRTGRRSCSTPRPTERPQAPRSTCSAFSSGTGLAQLPLPAGNFNGDPAYSPDGKQISFDQDIGQARTGGPRDLHCQQRWQQRPPTDHELRGATGGSTPNRSGLPTGRRSPLPGSRTRRKAAIFTIRVDGTGLTQLTPYKLDAASPDWSPDGSTIAFNTYWDSPHGNVARVMTMRPDGSHQKAITKDHFGNTASSTVSGRRGRRTGRGSSSPLQGQGRQGRRRALHDGPGRQATSSG